MVTRVRVLMCCAVLTAACVAPLAQPAPLVGTWEYRQANSASATGLDNEGERLVIREVAGGQLVAEYFGLERSGEHGLFYSAVSATIEVAPDGTVRLTVPARRLFQKRPESLERAAKLESAGRTAYELSLSGRVVGEELVMACSAGGASCPDSRMGFRRVPPPRK